MYSACEGSCAAYGLVVVSVLEIITVYCLVGFIDQSSAWLGNRDDI